MRVPFLLGHPVYVGVNLNANDCIYILLYVVIHCPRANGAKRRSGRKPGARVTNSARLFTIRFDLNMEHDEVYGKFVLTVCQLFYAFFPKNKKNIDRVAIVT